MKKLLLALGILACPLSGLANGPVYQNVVFVGSAPSGACVGGSPAQIVISTGVLYTCQSSVWAIVGGGGSFAYPTGTGIVRVASGTSWGTTAELSGDATTSGSNAVTVVGVNGAAVPTSASYVATNSSKQLVAATAPVTSVTGTANQIDVATGTTTPVISFDANALVGLGAARPLCRSHTDLPNTGSTSVNSIYSCTIPANTLGANSTITYQTGYVDAANSGSCTYHVYFGTTSTTVTDSVYSSGAAAASRVVLQNGILGNRNATNAQWFQTSGVVATTPTSGAGNVATNIDTTAASYLNFTTQNSVSGDACTTSFIEVDVQP